MRPLVSLCMPLYNGGRYLEEALRSAFAQTYPALELVISDDASTDDTMDIVRRLIVEAPMPVRVLAHEPSGIGANWNNCIRHANGAYIKFLFQDDLLTPDCVERLVALAISDPEVGLVYCRRHILHDPADPGHVAWLKKFGSLHRSWNNIAVLEGVMKGRDLLRDPAFLEHPNNKIGEPTAVLLHRDVFKREGLFEEGMRQALDYAFWYKVLRHFKVGFVDAELVSFRLHAAQATQVNADAKYDTDKQRLPGYYLRNLARYLHPKVLGSLLLSGTSVGRRFERSVLFRSIRSRK